MTRYDPIFAQAGELIICESGHLICRVARDIPLNAEHEDAFFTDWRTPVPKIGWPASLIPCPICSAPWFGVRGLHFESGWRGSA